MKMWSINKKEWFILDRGVIKFFKTSKDAWAYVLLMKEIRPHTTFYPSQTLYPVRTLDPRPASKVKKVTVFVIESVTNG